jgi:hypothetical protein
LSFSKLNGCQIYLSGAKGDRCEQYDERQHFALQTGLSLVAFITAVSARTVRTMVCVLDFTAAKDNVPRVHRKCILASHKFHGKAGSFTAHFNQVFSKNLVVELVFPFLAGLLRDRSTQKLRKFNLIIAWI